jgi:hypothetical protein
MHPRPTIINWVHSQGNKMKLVTILSIVLFLTGCAAANISSQVRESGVEGSSMITRCVNYTTGNDTETNGILKQFDGWRMIYMSEYTTPNKTNSAAITCFEQPGS